MAEIKMWEPLWGNQQPRAVDRDELSVIQYIALAADLSISEIDPVLDIKGRKLLRVKIFKGVESSILMYDYLFFGPLAFAGKNVSLVEQIEHGVTAKNREMSKVLDKNELIARIKTAVIKARRKNENLREAS